MLEILEGEWWANVMMSKSRAGGGFLNGGIGASSERDAQLASRMTTSSQTSPRSNRSKHLGDRLGNDCLLFLRSRLQHVSKAIEHKRKFKSHKKESNNRSVQRSFEEPLNKACKIA